jgi:hypothetical protein
MHIPTRLFPARFLRAWLLILVLLAPPRHAADNSVFAKVRLVRDENQRRAAAVRTRDQGVIRRFVRMVDFPMVSRHVFAGVLAENVETRCATREIKRLLILYG